jgi:hypothetical protein
VRAGSKSGVSAGKLLWVAGLLWAVYMMTELSLPYTAFRKNVDFLLTKQRVYHIGWWRFGFYVHVFTSVLVLLAGFTQFNRFFLYKRPLWHRRAGWVYIVAVLLLSAPSGFLIALKANGGLPARISFVLLSVTWFITTLQALLHVKKRLFEKHADWMLRSYALTLSAIALRTYAWLFDMLNVHMAPRNVYILIAWISWLPNLLVAQWLIKKGFNRRLLKPSTDKSSDA